MHITQVNTTDSSLVA